MQCIKAAEVEQSIVVKTRHMKFNQRTSGPVNAHLTPGPGIHFNAFIIVYSPMVGADNPLVTNADVNRKPLSLCPFVASFKTISLNSLSLCPFVDTKKNLLEV